MEQTNLQSFYERILNWLINSEMRSKDGAVYSWVNPTKPGYIYNEIIGYYIKLFSYLYKRNKNDDFLNRAIVSADYLSKNLSKSGGVSRGNIDYVFDSAICVSGLIALSKVTDLNKEQVVALRKLLDFVYGSLLKKQVAFKKSRAVVDLDKWSLSYGSLLIKNCIALYEAYEFFGDERYKKLAEQIAEELVEGTFKDGYFAINEKRGFVYTHSHCYATEGLLFMSAKGYDYEGTILKSADWLAKNQNEDGSMNNWYFREGVEIEKQGDATAQAIRIWCCVNKGKYIENIKKATIFLKSLQSKEGGLAYNKTDKGRISKDINSWVSIFAVQALLWQIEEPNKGWIV